ncbi:hypothetical protein [Candidatus Azobacteroides pseudotrichonymphae]|uniref:Uncharacterized protein n=1 Tax=Azobacteroides pseudotrichonymphae genomovar. CFP2 TaxID=511995 RepID=B6YS77_AZOPC|nr:hypothetical protein [Candidatus Azobacteroides pseudotrichonymphae]BAG84049.1 hypothetical protein CFPG_P1-28 [Candidatus Azobacteroides pseudotrichonymphae genomovar. CFP2]
MKKLLNTVLLTFVFLGFGFHLANGTKIYMIHPAPPALSTTIERSKFWNNEIWITLPKGPDNRSEEYYEKADYRYATFWASTNGSDVIIELAWDCEKESDGDVEGKAVYNRICSFFTQHNVPFSSIVLYGIQGSDDGYFRWTIAQEYIESVKID